MVVYERLLTTVSLANPRILRWRAVSVESVLHKQHLPGSIVSHVVLYVSVLAHVDSCIVYVSYFIPL